MFVSCVHSGVVEGSWEGIAGCVVHVDVHGECVCCGWMQCSMLAEGCSWLVVVHGYEVSFIPTECFIRKKLMFRLLVCSLHQSIHSRHKTLLCRL